MVDKILVTGASGFIGKECLKLLKNSNYEVHATYSRFDIPQNNDNSVIWHKTDLLNLEETEDIILKVKPTHLLHLAWVTTHGKYWSSYENLDWLKSGMTILKAFNKVKGKRVIISGSCAEYDWRYGLCSEDITPISPFNLYGNSKYSFYSMVKSFSMETKISFAWGRLFFVYGPNENPSRLIPYVINSLIKKENVNCTNGKQIRDFIHVHDVARILLDLVNSNKNLTINIGSGEPIKVSEIIYKIANHFNSNDLIMLGNLPSQDEYPVILSDKTKLQTELNFTPYYSIDSGIEMTINWWKNKGAH